MRKSKFLSLLLALAVMTTMLLVPPPDTVLAAINETNATLGTIYNADKFSTNPSTINSISMTSDTKSSYEQLGKPFGEFDNIPNNYKTYVAGNNATGTLKYNIEQPGYYNFYMLLFEFNGYYPSVSLDDTQVFDGSKASGLPKYGTITYGTDSSRSLTVANVSIEISEAKEYTIKLTNNSSQSTQGLLAVNLVHSEVSLTQNDVITASDIVRDSSRSREAYSSGYVDLSTVNVQDNCPSELKELFGNDFGKAGKLELAYTDTTDQFRLKVTKPGNYNIFILGINDRNTKLTFKKLGSESPITMTSNQSQGTVAQAQETGKESSQSILYFNFSEPVKLDEGFYTVYIEKGTGGYYTNFVALGFSEVPPTGELNEGVSDSGWYDTQDAAKVGVIRFLQQYSGDNVTEYGFYIVRGGDGTVVDQTKTTVSSETDISKMIESGGFFTDVDGITENNEESDVTYYAKAFVKFGDSDVVSSKSIEGKVNWNRQIDYTPDNN